MSTEPGQLHLPACATPGRVVHSHRTYQPRDTEHSVLHAVIREHLEPFLREISDRGELAPVSRRPRAVCAPALTGRPLRPPGP